DEVLREEFEEPRGERTKLFRPGLEDREWKLVRQVQDRESAGNSLPETARRVRVAGRDGDEICTSGAAGPVDGHDPARWFAFRVHLVARLLEHPVPHDCVPDRILLEERADALPIRGVQWRGPAMSEAGKSLTSRRWSGSHPLSCGRPTPDRKSTRLNSSHVSISYAVFC